MPKELLSPAQNNVRIFILLQEALSLRLVKLNKCAQNIKHILKNIVQKQVLYELFLRI